METECFLPCDPGKKQMSAEDIALDVCFRGLWFWLMSVSQNLILPFIRAYPWLVFAWPVFTFFPLPPWPIREIGVIRG
jgi:hypothetical protein